MVVTASTLFIMSPSSSSVAAVATSAAAATASPTLLGLLFSHLPVPMANPHPPLANKDVMLDRRWVK